MTAPGSTSSRSIHAVARALRLAPTFYAMTLFLSALLLFLLQPMFTKMVLPRLGGAPAVWSAAMVFFQAALLGGYAYAHLLVRWIPFRLGALIHVGVLGVTAATLPIGIAQGLGAPPTSGIALWVLGLFAASIGLPFAALSASAPLLQAWLAATDHIRARNPYILYAASNLGSFAALISYPVAIEPLLSLKDQVLLWSTGFVVVGLCIAVASLFVVRLPYRAAAVEPSTEAPSRRDRITWAALSAIPAGLVIAVTAHITTDIAAAPFLWVMPLALYLLSFVAIFRDRPWIRHDTVVRLAPISVVPLAIALPGSNNALWLVMIAINLLALLLLSLLCHGELYQRRPAASQLTRFYLWVAFGGMLGGVFAALLAPHIFTRVYEYPILVAAAILVLPGFFAGGVGRIVTQAAPVLLVLLMVVAAKLVLDIRISSAAVPAFLIMLLALFVIMLLQRHRPVRFFALVVLGFVVTDLWQPGLNRVETARSFFGVHQVFETADGSHRLLYHGTTMHGAERIREPDGSAAKGPPEPLTYFYFGGPISEVIKSVRAARGGLRRVAVAGLGTGSLACHKHEKEHWVFFEIDPEVVKLARDPRLFSFVSACAPDLPVVPGDARLTLARSAQSFDLIILDVFSSDAIPVHLLTREALAGYLTRLEARGAVALHISQRHMDLGRVVAATAAAAGLVTYLKEGHPPETSTSDLKSSTIVAALARKADDLGDLPARSGWREIKPEARIHAWTDDYSDIVGAILRRKLGH
jgi:spermidine synthase